MKSVFITGTSTGIGLYTARHLHHLGWQVFAGVLPGEDTSELTEGMSEHLHVLPVDITKPEMIHAARETITKHTSKLDGLVNNAGIPMTGPMEFMPMDDIRKIMEVNFFGHVSVSQAMIPMIREARGRIVNVTSILGRFVTTYGGAYSASKFAMEAFTDALRLELMPWGIEVSAIEPTVINTAIWGKVDEWNDMIFAELPSQAKELYLDKMEVFAKASAEQRSTGVSPQMVAEKITHALTAPKPKTRYLVGKSARLYDFIGRFLPDRLRDRILSRRLNMD